MPITYPVSYSTVSEVLTTLPMIGSVSNITSAHLATYLGKAQAEINTKLSRLYSIPFTVEVPILQTLATDMAVYFVLAQRIFTQEKQNKSEWPEKYKRAIEILDDIADGKIMLIDSTGAVIEGRGDIAEVFSNTMDYVPTMAEIDITDESVDKDKIDDEIDRRGL